MWKNLAKKKMRNTYQIYFWRDEGKTTDSSKILEHGKAQQIDNISTKILKRTEGNIWNICSERSQAL